jgi:hypothetical protein
MLETDAETSPPERDWLPLLDRELNGLPDRYRLPIVLCELQGMSHKEAASELGCPIGTVSGRLSRGRNLLAKRLARYGVGLTAGSLSAALAQQEAAASLPAAVVSATVKAATAGVISAEIAALTEGVVKAMFLAKLKVVTVILGTAVVLTAAALACTALAGGQPQDKGDSTKKPPIRADDKPDKPKEPAGRTDDKPGTPDKPKDPFGRTDEKPGKRKELVKGLTAKIVVRGNVPNQIEKLELDLVLTNEGDQPVRLCTLCIWGITANNFANSISMRPNGNDSSISAGELEKNTVTLKPGDSVAIDLPKLSKARSRSDGKYRIDAAYTVSKEFAEAHKTWQGHVHAETIIELAGDPKPAEDKIKADKIKPGDRIYIYVSPSLPDHPIRAIYEVEPSGKVALGPGYGPGHVLVADMTLEEAEVAIYKFLPKVIKDPAVSVSRTAPTPVSEGANPELERRVQQLEREVRALRSELDEIKKKPRDQ